MLSPNPANFWAMVLGATATVVIFSPTPMPTKAPLLSRVYPWTLVVGFSLVAPMGLRTDATLLVDLLLTDVGHGRGRRG
jgi:hypothetical protein